MDIFKHCLLLFLVLLSQQGLAKAVLWEENQTKVLKSKPLFKNTTSSVKVNIDVDQIQRFKINDQFLITLESGVIKEAVIDHISNHRDMLLVKGHILNEPNSSFRIKYKNTKIDAHILLKSREIAYRLKNVNQNSFLLKKKINNLICSGMPTKPNRFRSIFTASSQQKKKSAISSPVNSVPMYSSRPGAARVIYLDFDGETISNTSWNFSENFGKPIVAEPFDLDGIPQTFNDEEQTYIKQAWERTKEAYSIYNVNVTTSKATFNSTPVSQRIRVMITPTDLWFRILNGESSGVAYFDSFGQNEPAWVFFDPILNGADIGLIAVHEIGHTVGLEHDGLNASEYHDGQDGWGPFMGAPYYSSHVTFSNGDYDGATEFQPDLSVVAKWFPLLADYVGNNNSNSTTLSLRSSKVTIERRIGIFNDKDVYRVKAERGQIINASIEALGEYPTLNTLSSLYDSSGKLLTSNDITPTYPLPLIETTSLNSSITYKAPKDGDYFLHIKGNGYNRGQSDDYSHSSYGEVGRYQMKLSVENGIAIEPVIYLLLD